MHMDLQQKPRKRSSSLPAHIGSWRFPLRRRSQAGRDVEMGPDGGADSSLHSEEGSTGSTVCKNKVCQRGREEGGGRGREAYQVFRGRGGEGTLAWCARQGAVAANSKDVSLNHEA